MANAAMYGLIALLACLCFQVRGYPSVFDDFIKSRNGIADVYNYSATVSVGQNEPTPFASKFHIKGKLIVKGLSESDEGIPFVTKFQDMKYTIYNGKADDDIYNEYQVLNDSFKELENPFLIIWKSNLATIKGVKIINAESICTKNMKKAVAFMFQARMSNSSRDVEDTIYGKCKVDYTALIGSKIYDSPVALKKVFQPQDCSDYVGQRVDYDRKMKCNAEKEEDLVTSSKTIYEYSPAANHSAWILKKITSLERSSYLPWLHRGPGIQTVEITQTLELESSAADSEFGVAKDFDKISTTDDLKFLQFNDRELKTINDEESNNQDDIGSKVKEQLNMMVDYMKENHFNLTEENSEHKNIIQKLLSSMILLKETTIYNIYSGFTSSNLTEKEILARKIFFKLVSHTGTEAAWKFALRMINQTEVANSRENTDQLIAMLIELPMYVLNPTEDLARSTIRLRNLNGDNVKKELNNAAVLSYSILLHKIYKNAQRGSVPEFLQEQLEYFNARLHNEPTYESKITYIMAMKNVQVGNILQYLEPIVKGRVSFNATANSTKLEKYRIAAIWAVAESISQDADLTYNLFWPILSDGSESLAIRVAVYENLISRNPKLDMNLLMNVHWLMVDEPDEHLFNYHHSTLKSTAESKDPCVAGTAESMRKVLRLTKTRKVLSNSLSRVNLLDFVDEKYGYGIASKFGVEVDEATGMPQSGFFEFMNSFARRRSISGVYWNIEGVNLNTVINFFKRIIQMKTGSNMHEQSLYEISDDKVKKLLKQTYGYKLLDKNIHVEFWSMSRGYATGVTVYSEGVLSDRLGDFIDKYKSMNLMDIGDIFDFDWLSINYPNRYRMIVPTAIGFPAVFYNEAPRVYSVKLKPDVHLFKTIVIMKIEFEARFFGQSSYKMTVDNPMIDVVHSIERRADTDAVLPIDMTLGFNLETRNLKMVLSRMPFTRFSTAGMKTYAVDSVQIENDSSNLLKRLHCSTCDHTVRVVKNSSRTVNYEEVHHSLDTGLDFNFVIFDCECDRRHLLIEELMRVLRTPVNDENGDLWPNLALRVQHVAYNFVNVLYATSCGLMLKISPCQNHPTSHIEMDWRFNAEKDVNGVQLNVRGTWDTKEFLTNNTSAFWNLGMDAEMLQFSTDFKLHLTRNTMQEKNLKICFQAHKEYSNFISENRTINHRDKYETLTKMHFTMGYTDADDCSDDSMTISAIVQGELLDEQLEQMRRNVKPGACFRNKDNPLDLDVTQRFDWNCLYEAVKATTMRKYTYDFTYQKIPPEIWTKLLLLDEVVRFETFPRVSYGANRTEPGHLRVALTYSLSDNYYNVTVMNPTYSYDLIDVQYGIEDPDDKGNDFLLDNAGFTTGFLMDYYKGDIRPCIAHANDVITDLNKTIGMNFNDWTLMSGDYGLLTYAVFVKAAENNRVAVKIYACTHVLEIQPGDPKPIVTLNDAIVNDYEKGVLLPALNKHFKIMMVNQLLVVETEKYSKVKVYYTPNNVVVLPHTASLRTIDGICGHMGSTAYNQQYPLVYNSSL